MQAVENWLKYCKRPLPKCFKEFIEKQTEGEKDRLRDIYTDVIKTKKTQSSLFQPICFSMNVFLLGLFSHNGRASALHWSTKNSV
jgi:hypothetical protein